MDENKFVVQESHFHIADPNRYVLTGWFRDKVQERVQRGSEMFEVFLDCERLDIQVRCIADDSVRRKYEKYGFVVEEEYVIIAKLPANLSRYRKMFLHIMDGDDGYVFEKHVAQLCKLQSQLNYQITNIQSTGASCVVSGWAASEKPIKINVYDQTKALMKCEVSHFARPEAAYEFRESECLSDGGFSVTVPVSGRKKMLLEITDGESSVIQEFRAAGKNCITLYLKKAHYYMKRNGIKKAFRRAVNELYEMVSDTGNYMKWRKKHTASQKELELQRQDDRTCRPLIYVITPYQDFHHFTWAAISLKRQTYVNWKWVIACTELEKEKVMERIHSYVPKSRIVFVSTDGQEGYQQKIARAVRETVALLQAQETGQEYVRHAWMTLLAPSDTLEPDAFYACTKLFEQYPQTDMCYTDEDQISEDGKLYLEPVFKSDFNIDMLRATNYFGHMVLIRADLAVKIGLWNPAYGQDAAYDYYLRAVELAKYIGHLPKAVYHVREGGRQARPAPEAVLNAHYRRLGVPAKAELSCTPGICHTVYQWEQVPMVSVNIPNKDHVDDLDTCVQSILNKCTYPNYEIVIIENNSVEDRTFVYYDKLKVQDSRVRVVYWQQEFNYSEITNFGVSKSNGSYILLLNNDTEVITPNFMEEMLGYCMREDVGICGARLFYFDQTIQHAGVVIGIDDICGEGFQGFPKENGGYQNRIFCPQDYSAVTAACLMTKKSVFEEVGGMDSAFQVAYNDIDYCLKVRSTGRLVVYNPFAMLYHYEYKSRGDENTPQKLERYHREVRLFTTRWAGLIHAGDPYYNPNLTRRYNDFSLKRKELI